MQDQYEEVDLITKGGNYGWSIYEGPLRFKNTSADDSLDPIFPVLGYRHSDINKEVGSAAISGGYVYRSKTDPYVLTSTGVYRVVRPSRCNYTCSMETARTAESQGPSAPSDGHVTKADLRSVLVLYCLLLLTSFILSRNFSGAFWHLLVVYYSILHRSSTPSPQHLACMLLSNSSRIV